MSQIAQSDKLFIAQSKEFLTIVHDSDSNLLYVFAKVVSMSSECLCKTPFTHERANMSTLHTPVP